MSQSNLTFDVQKGLLAPDTDRIIAFVQEEFKKVFGNDINLEPSSPQGQLITTLAAMISTKNTEVLKLANQFNPLTAQGVFQEALGRIYFLERKIARPTIVYCQCTGLAGTVIPAGALVESSEGIRFYAGGEHTIDETQNITVEFICEKPGVIQVQPNTITKIITVVPGWDTVNNTNAGIVGRTEETQAEFERRRYASVAKNAHGTAAALYGALAGINNVIDVVVLENRTNETIEEAGVSIEGHSVYISVVGGTDTDIAETVYNKLGCGCGTTGNVSVSYTAAEYFGTVYNYKINRPEELDIYIKIKIKETDKTPATVDEDIKNAVMQNFEGLDSTSSSRVRMAENLYASRFYCTILSQGVQELLEVSVSTDNETFESVLFIPADRFPVLKKENITVELEKG